MWWFIRKKTETEGSVVYLYGAQTRQLSGTVSYDKKAKTLSIEKLADGESETSTQFLLSFMYRFLSQGDFPDEKQIAIA